MRGADLLVDAFGRIRDAVRGAVRGLTSEELACRVDDEANSIAWLVWHLSRIQDDHVAAAAGAEQVWTLDRVVDTSWDPPVTLGVRLVSVVADDLEHAGQAALVRGVVERR